MSRIKFCIDRRPGFLLEIQPAEFRFTGEAWLIAHTHRFPPLMSRLELFITSSAPMSSPTPSRPRPSPKAFGIEGRKRPTLAVQSCTFVAIDPAHAPDIISVELKI